MDLHGLWSRLTGNPDTASEAPGRPTPGSPEVAADRRTPAWRTLPPITPTAHGAPLIAQRSPFEPGLGGLAPTPLALAPLGHERSLEAPAGLVTAVHAPVAARAAEPVPGSVRPAGRGRRPGGEAPAAPSWPADEPTAEAVTEHDTHAPVLAAPASRPAPASRAAPVVARMPAVEPLTEAPAVAAPSGFVGPSPLASAPAAAAASDAPPRPGSHSTSGTDELDPGGINRPVDTIPPLPGTHEVHVARSTAAPTPAEPLVARRNLGQSRRLRIGPAIEPVARPAASGGLGPTIQRAVESTPDPMPQFPTDPLVEPAVELGAASAGLSVARTVAPDARPDRLPADALAPTPDPGSSAARSDPIPTHPIPTDAVPLRPLAGRRPEVAPLLGTLRPTLDAASPAVAITRAPDEDEIETSGGVAAALAALNAPGGLPAPDSGPAIARRTDPSDGGMASRGGPRGGGPAGPAPSGGAGTGRFGRGGEVAGPPGRGAPVGGSSGTARSAAAAPSLPVVARSPVPAASGVSATGPAAPFGSDRGASPGLVGGTSRLRVGPAVARSVEPAPESGGSSLSSTVAAGPPVAPSADDASPSTVLRAAADPAPGVFDVDVAAPGFGPTTAGVQRAAEDVAASAPATGGPAGGTAGAAGPTSGPELDALAARLYDRLRLRLRRELLADRERAGVLIDMGH